MPRLADTPRVVENAGCTYEVMKKDAFRTIRELCRAQEGWVERYRDTDICVWTHPPDPTTGTKLDMIKIRAEYLGVEPLTLYDCLHDAEYRKSWDTVMIKGYNICELDSHNDIGYYGAKLPMPLSNRDFCNMRSWIELGKDQGYIIRNHSVPHPDCPPQKGFVRGRSICSGYYILPREGGGTVLWWISQSDPSGFIPHWLVNTVTTKSGPAIIRKLGEHASNYLEWCKKNPRETQPRWRTEPEPWSDEEELDDNLSVSKPNIDPSSVGLVRDVPVSASFDRAPVTDAPPMSSTLPAQSDSSTVELREEIDRLQRKLTLATQESRWASSLAPMRYSPEEPECVLQTRSILQEVFDFTDRTFLAEKKAPTMREYSSRVHGVLGALLSGDKLDSKSVSGLD